MIWEFWKQSERSTVKSVRTTNLISWPCFVMVHSQKGEFNFRKHNKTLKLVARLKSINT